MRAGRILPVFRQFFETPITNNTGRDGSPQQQGYEPPQERDATEDEARKAAEILRESEEFKKNNLSVEPGLESEKWVLFVRSGNGALLRSIKSSGIHLIIATVGLSNSPRQGRILDRRI